MAAEMCFKDLTRSTVVGTASPLSLSPLVANKGSSNSCFPSAVTSIEITFL